LVVDKERFGVKALQRVPKTLACAIFEKKKFHVILANSGKVSHECGKDDGTGGENALDE